MRSAEEIIKITGGELLSGEIKTVFGRIITDSRKIKAGDCFAAINGKNENGNDYISEAKANGCKVILTDKEIITGEMCTVRTENTEEALLKLAGYYREKELTKVTAITGSVGKTTVKELVSLILSEDEKVRKTEGNQNNLLGLPLSVLGGYEEKTGVFELGISEKGEMEKLSEAARPDIAIITSVGKMHMEYFLSREETAREKLKIKDHLKKDGWLLVDGDEPLLKANKSEKEYTLNVSVYDKKADFFADNILQRDGYSVFDMYFAGRKVITGLKIPITGIHGVKNALFAAGAGYLYGAPYEDIRSGLAKYKPDGMRQNIENTGKFVLFSDCYNAGPESFSASLEALKIVKENRKIKNICIIAGSMLELGEISEKEHLDLGRKIATIGPKTVLTVGEEAEFIAEGARSAGLKEESVLVFAENEIEAIKKYLFENVGKFDLFFIKGSRRLKLERLSEYLKSIGK